MRKMLIAVGIFASVYVLAHLLVIPFATIVNASKPSGETPTDWGYRYTNITLKKPGATRVSAWYVEAENPKGQIILMAHNGGNKSVSLMRWTAGLLINHGFNIALADPRGQGESRGIKTYGAGEAVDAAHLADLLAEDHPDLPVGGLGYSLGAAALIRAMGLTDRIAAVAAFAPYSRMDGALVRQEIEFQTGGRWTGVGVLPGLLAGGFRLWAFTARHIPQPIEVVGDLGDRGLLLMHFTDDPELPSKYSKELFAAGGPTVQLHLYDGEMHVPWRRNVDFDTDFTQRVVSFFDEWCARKEGS